MYRLIALDVDGTLLSSDGHILPSTVEAIAWARSKGVRVVLSTGRSAREAAWFTRLAGCDNRAVCLSGGAIADAVTGHHVRQFPLPPEAAEAAIPIILRYPFLCLDVFAGPHNLVTPFTRKTFAALQPNDCMHQFMVESEDPIGYIREHKLEVCKIFAATTGPDLTEAVAQLQTIPGVETINCDGANLEVLLSGVSKGAALTLLAQEWGIPMEEVIAIGDSSNDLSMFAAAGMPVAMGNGSPAARAAARFITDTNNRDGIAKAIRELLA